MKTQILAAALLIGSSTYALAADAVVDEVVVVDSAYNWSGVYVGGLVGYGWGDTRYEDDSDVTTDPIDLDGASVGLTVGYNYQFHPNWVAGVEADVSWSGIDASEPTTPDGNWGCGDACTTEVEWYGTVRARLGYAMDRFLVYGTGGLAVGRVKGELENSGPEWVTKDTNVGWAAGAGVEYAFTQNWTAKLEYMHVDLGWTDRSGINDFRTDADFDAVRVGINYKF